MLKKGFVFWGIILGGLSLLLRLVATPSWIEQYYSRGFFPLFRLFWDTILTGWFPVALLYVLVPILLLRFVRAIYQWSKRRGSARWTSLLGGMLGFSGWLVFTFLLFWGFNYGRIPVEDRLGLTLDQLELTEVISHVRTEATALAALRQSIAPDDTLALQPHHFPSDMEHQLRTALESSLSYYSYPVVGSVRARVLSPRGIFLRFSTAGLYLPWTGEGHVDAGLLHLQRPYTMAHEMAHGYGFGDEGSCSFWALLAAYRLQNPVLQYAIRLGYWRSMAASWSRSQRDTYLAFRATLPPAIFADLDAINQNNLAYPDIMPQFRDAAYDSYLKAQGISEGLANYSKVVRLVEAWKKQEDGFIGAEQ